MKAHNFFHSLAFFELWSNEISIMVIRIIGNSGKRMKNPTSNPSRRTKVFFIFESLGIPKRFINKIMLGPMSINPGVRVKSMVKEPQ